jgi:hypothetical protein
MELLIRKNDLQEKVARLKETKPASHTLCTTREEAQRRNHSGDLKENVPSATGELISEKASC